MKKSIVLTFNIILLLVFTNSPALTQSLPGDSFGSVEKSASNAGQFYGGAALKLFEKNGLLGAGVGNSSQSTQIDVTTSPSGEWIVLAEPTIKLGYEVFGGVITELTAGYRITSSLDIPGLENNNINCPVFGLTLKLSNVGL
jgi:hypothetical protein